MAQAEPALQLTSSVVWSEDAPWFGGFSGAEVDPDGKTITLVTDAGYLVSADMIRKGGKLTGLTLRDAVPLAYYSGTPLRGVAADAEGLAIGTGGAFVSFEHMHRVSRLFPQSGRTQGYVGSPDFDRLQPNSGLEALAIHPDGTLYTLPERSGGKTKPFPLYALTGNRWSVAHQIPRRDAFLPVGADFDDSGLFYLLERDASPFGFRSRIRRFDLAAPDLDERTLLTTGAADFDNLEALSVWRDATGRTMLTLVSDDNFLPVQRTQIVEFSLTE